MSLRDGLRDLRNDALALPARLGLAPRPSHPVNFVVERQNWSIRWDGLQIAANINRERPGTVAVTDRPWRLNRTLAHFGSQFLWELWAPRLARSNRVVVTYFHGKPEDGPRFRRHLDAVLAGLDRIDRIVTAATLVEHRLLGWGVPRAKLVRIPIGVDTHRFRPPTGDERAAARRRFEIADDRLVIGSFQKDGVGWGDGMAPKHEKGPDLFVAAMARLARHHPVTALLTGPARGYVKAGLDAAGVPWRHVFFDDYFDLVTAYHALDLYLMTSREEGGPKSLMESAATGVPVVSTRVGMADDVIRDGITGRLAEPGDLDGLVTAAADLLADAERRDTMAAAAIECVDAWDWSHVAHRHLVEVYDPLMERDD
jgi:glycosyltransferase involved in cell wall biosynthesis